MPLLSSSFPINPRTMPTLAAVLCFIRFVGFGYWSVLFFVTLSRPIRSISFISLLPKRLASPASSQRHNKSLNTGLAIRSRSLFNTGYSQPVKQTLCGFPSSGGNRGTRAVSISDNIESCRSSSAVVLVRWIIQTKALSSASWWAIRVQFGYQQYRCFLLWC